ncbi:MAG: [Eubacterium sp.]|nr:[FeFe] hydrogenase H-cluster maturation GTPase HydF [Eubacterium sp.]
MGLNDTPSGERLHISFFGRRNAGKSSLVNAVTGQDLAVVSEKKGTTTDPVSKAMELLPIGPVMIIDTPGYDDEGELGRLRVRKTRQILNRTDLAVLVVDGALGLSGPDRELIDIFREKDLPWLIVYNKKDLLAISAGSEKKEPVSECSPESETTSNPLESFPEQGDNTIIYVSALTGEGIHGLKERIAKLGHGQEKTQPLAGNLVAPADLALLVIPIDKSAPKGRLILPQQQVIRDLLDHGAGAVCVKEDQLPAMLEKFVKPPALVITDSQVFARVAEDVPEEIPLTSFSILMARYKGFLAQAVEGVKAIDSLKNGDRILIAEGCTHHRQCEDIGTVKIPAWLKKRTGKDLVISTCSGRDFPEDLSSYALIIHCGGCMLNNREVRYRMKCAADQGVPITNYGTAIAFMKGILERSIKPVMDIC